MPLSMLESKIVRAEAQVQQLLLAHDVDALQAWLSPSLFFTDAEAQWLRAHPCLAAWSARQVRVTALDQGAVEYLICGQLALVASDVRLGHANAAGEGACELRLLRVWASCSTAAGVHLLSVGLLPARGA
ncbi:nuclear transport factor 2 family protein [Bacillus subtilis subsp. subtilis]|nr:nuclear transport factor 2 family protein [Bacillus subtilis subsp. subtilis]